MGTQNDPSSPVDLSATRVGDTMHAGIVSCASDVPLVDVAERMSSERIHCVVVRPGRDSDDPRAWGVISDLDLVGAADMPNVSAGAIAATPTVTVSADEGLDRAVKLMTEYETAHLLVVDADGQPTGVVSTLDVARAMSGRITPA